MASAEIFGKGTSDVREILGVWKVSSQNIQFKVKPPEKIRLLKSAIYTTIMSRSQFFNLKSYFKIEQEIGQRISHLAAKYPPFDLDNSIHLMIRKQRGKNLLDFIEWQALYSNSFSVLNYLLLCRRLFQSYAQQIHAIKFLGNNEDELVHRDIKPENIIFDPSAPQAFKFIDFAFATFKKITREQLGTPLYMPPDHYLSYTDKLVSKSTDIFALILICTELSGEGTRSKFKKPSELKEHNKDINFPDLFKALQPCTIPIKEKIRNLWRDGTRFESSTREHLTHEFIIAELNQFIITYCKNMTAQSAHLQFRLIEIQSKLNQYDQLPSAIQEQLELEFLAVECLNESKTLPVDCLKENQSLDTLWTEHRNVLLQPLLQKLENRELTHQPHTLKKLQAAIHYTHLLNPLIIDALYQDPELATEPDCEFAILRA
ncbi:MAG: serine/threonine-protein kinase [Legionella sp.]|nr:serine/threonine-protein kinase [Legionella sp.]